MRTVLRLLAGMTLAAALSLVSLELAGGVGTPGFGADALAQPMGNIDWP